MKKMAFFVVAIILSGCAPSTPVVSFERQAIAATKQAVEEQANFQAKAAEATQRAYETQQAMEKVSADLQVTAQAFSIEAQKTAQANEATLQTLQITAQYLDNQQRQQDLQITQVAGQATATAIVAESVERVNKQRSNEVLATLIPILLCVGGFTAIATCGYGLYIFMKAKVDRQRFVETSIGPIFLLPGGMWSNFGDDAIEELPEVIARPSNSGKAPQVWTSPGGSTAFSSQWKGNGAGETLDKQTLVRTFLRNASNAAGPLEVQFPRWDKMGWHSDTWKRAKNILEEANLVYSVEREGTYVNEERHPNIGALNAAVFMGQYRF